jgi:hypothetical protein
MRWISAAVRLFLIGVIVVAFAGALLLAAIYGPQGDMERQIARIKVPSDFTQVGWDSGGLRVRFAAANAPLVSRSFAAPWDAGRLCERVAAVANALREVHEEPKHHPQSRRECSFSGRIPASWNARLVNVWSYWVNIYAIAPESVTRFSDPECAEIRAQHTAARRFRDGRCWVPHGEAMVVIEMHSKQGW